MMTEAEMLCIEREIAYIEPDGTIFFVCAKSGLRCVDEDLVECGKVISKCQLYANPTDQNALLKVIKINWIDKDGNVISSTITNDEYNEENVSDLTQYINDTTEGLDAPNEWDQFDLVAIEVD
jgi:hypothetical protein